MGWSVIVVGRSCGRSVMWSVGQRRDHANGARARASGDARATFGRRIATTRFTFIFFVRRRRRRRHQEVSKGERRDVRDRVAAVARLERDLNRARRASDDARARGDGITARAPRAATWDV